MATVENPKEGKFEEVPQKPDPVVEAQNLQEQGFTKEQVESAVQRLPVNRSFGDALLSGFDDAYDIDEIIPDRAINPAMTSKGARDKASLIADLSGTPKEDITAAMETGEDFYTDQVYAEVAEEERRRALIAGEEAVQAATTPEEVTKAVEDTRMRVEQPIVMPDLLRVKMGKELELDDLPRADRIIRENFELAREAAKAEERIWEQASFLDIMVDFGEIIPSYAGFITDESNKINLNIGKALDRVADAGTPEQKRQVLLGIIDDWETSETVLFGRNNSLLKATQIGGLASAIREGGLQYLDGEITEAEFINRFETAVGAALGATATVGIYKGFKGVLKWFSHQIMPKNVNSDAVRGGSSLKDIEYAVKPEQSAKDLAEKGAKTTAEDAGLDYDEAALRHMPIGSVETHPAWANINQGRSEVNDLMLSDESLVNMGMKRARVLEVDAGSSLTVQESATAFDLTTASEDSLGTFKFLLGDGANGGFKTHDEAARALESSTIRDTARIKTVDDRYYVEVDMPHRFNARLDVTDLKTKDGVSKAPTWLLDPLRVLGSEVLRGLFVLKNRNRAIAEGLEDRVQKVFSGMKGDEAELVAKALQKGDKNEKIYSNYGTFLAATGSRKSAASRKAFENYLEIRKVYDEVYNIRNKNFYNAKESMGYKMVKVGDDSDLGRRIKHTDTEQPEVYNTTTGKFVKPTENDIVMKLDNTIDTAKGRVNEVIVRADDVGKLPYQLLRKRKGHIDRMYRDTGWVVRVSDDVIINGRSVTKPSITHIVKSRDEAVRIATKLREEGKSVDFSRSRENNELDTIFGDNDSVQFTYGGVHTRKRGEQLRGSDNELAPILDVYESLSSTISSVERQLDVDAMQALKNRFYNQFSSILAKGHATPFSNDITRMLKSDLGGMDKEAAKVAKQWHGYIASLNTMKQGQMFDKVDEMVDNVTSFLGLNRVGFPSSDTQKISTKLQEWTAKFIIVGRPLFQIPQNLVQAFYVAMRNPAGGTKAAPQLSFLMPNILGLSDNYWAASKALGVSEDMAKQVVADLKSSGMLKGIGRADDYLSLTSAALSNPKSSFVNKAKGLANMPFKASQTLQEGSVKIVNALAYLSEFNALKAKRGADFKFNAATKAEISFAAQKMTATQNNMNRFSYQDQSSLLSMMFQFTQHVHKIFLDVVLDPAVKLATGKNVGKEASAFSPTRKAAALSVISVMGLFGINGVMGEGAGGWSEDFVRRNFPELANNPVVDTMFKGGLLNYIVNGAARTVAGEGRVDVTAKMGPAAILDVVNDYYLENPQELDVTGAVGGIVTDVYKRVGWGGTAWVIASNPEMDTAEKVKGFTSEIAGIVKGFSDYQKAQIASQMGAFPYTSTYSSNLKATFMESLFLAANIPPDLVSDYMRRADFKPSTKEDSEKIAEIMIKRMSVAMADAKERGDFDILKSLELAEEYLGYAKASVDETYWEDIEKVFTTKALKHDAPTYEAFIRPYIETALVGERVEELTILLQKAETEQAKKEIQDEIDFYKLFDDNHREIYEGNR